MARISGMRSWENIPARAWSAVHCTLMSIGMCCIRVLAAIACHKVCLVLRFQSEPHMSCAAKHHSRHLAFACGPISYSKQRQLEPLAEEPAHPLQPHMTRYCRCHLCNGLSLQRQAHPGGCCHGR